MKAIVKLMLILFSVGGMVNHAQAQSKMTDEQKQEAKARYEAYKQKLNLTEEQSKKVDAINSTYFEGVSALRSSGASKLSKYKKFKALNAEKDKQMKEVLTKEQFKQYKDYQAQLKEERKNRRQG